MVVPYARLPGLEYGVNLNIKFGFVADAAILLRCAKEVINPVADGAAPPLRNPPPHTVSV